MTITCVKKSEGEATTSWAFVGDWEDAVVCVVGDLFGYTAEDVKGLVEV